MDIHLLSYYLGILIVTFSHIYMLTVGVKSKDMNNHAWLNLFAVFCIAYYFTNKEKMIKF
jgi:hypothetical protein